MSLGHHTMMVLMCIIPMLQNFKWFLRLKTILPIEKGKKKWRLPALEMVISLSGIHKILHWSFHGAGRYYHIPIIWTETWPRKVRSLARNTVNKWQLQEYSQEYIQEYIQEYRISEPILFLNDLVILKKI